MSIDLDQVYERIEAPTATPHPFGLFSVSPPVMPGDSTTWQIGVQWNSLACEEVAVWSDPCITGEAPVDKTYGSCGPLQTAKPFTIYAGRKRAGIGWDDAVAEAAGILAAGEELAVEMGLWEQLIAASAPAAPPSLDPNPVISALGAVEAALGTAYHGTGVIHMNRGIATILGALLTRVGSHLETMAGTPVAAGAGYGTEAIYGTGQVSIRRSTTDSITGVNRATNDNFALAERTYLVGWDCAVVGHSTGGA